MSGVTDCYQPAERHFRITRACLEVLAEFRNPVSIITKNFLVTRDIDVLKELAAFDAVHVSISITTLNADLAAKMEPRASRPAHRLRAVEMLAQGGHAGRRHGRADHSGAERPRNSRRARGGETRGRDGCAGYTMLRLPHGVKDVFPEWLQAEFSRAARPHSRHRPRACAAASSTSAISARACAARGPTPSRSRRCSTFSANGSASAADARTAHGTFPAARRNAADAGD